MKKRIIALLLTAVMFFSVCPAVSAEEVVRTISATGYQNPDAIWTIEVTDVVSPSGESNAYLTVEGKGEFWYPFFTLAWNTKPHETGHTEILCL